jgi:hypothetical protein
MDLVTVLLRSLLVLMAVRVLLPPGICICRYDAAAGRLLGSWLNVSLPALPAPVEDDDDDHEPGCPCSPLAAALGLIPAAVTIAALELNLAGLPGSGAPPASAWVESPFLAFSLASLLPPSVPLRI